MLILKVKIFILVLGIIKITCFQMLFLRSLICIKYFMRFQEFVHQFEKNLLGIV